ncbi:MAG TPA: hypothetical protein PKC03_11245 [Dokdonella sp.]|nr:hypothetical protein [Dokdonella sp.]
MYRQFLTLLLLSTLAGCATTSGNSYNYDDNGDYYYGSGRADVVVDSHSSGFGYAGLGYGGYGSGYGYGYGLGFGYGFGYPRYGSLFYPWGYGWSPIWAPPPVYIVERNWRDARVQQDRSQRSFLLARPAADAPESASYARRARAMPADALRGPGRFDPGKRAPTSTRTLRSRNASGTTSNRARSMAAPQPRVSAPAPAMRVAPPPARIPTHKQ